MKVYAVTSGCYSDYSVSCIFEQENDAEKYAAAMNKADRWNNDYDVEEFDYYPSGVVPVIE